MVDNAWKITVRSKDFRNIQDDVALLQEYIDEDERAQKIFEDDFYLEGHYSLDGKPLFDMASTQFNTSSMHAEDELLDFLKEVTCKNPDLIFEIFQHCNYDDYYRHVVADGTHETQVGEIVYPHFEYLKYTFC